MRRISIIVLCTSVLGCSSGGSTPRDASADARAAIDSGKPDVAKADAGNPDAKKTDGIKGDTVNLNILANTRKPCLTSSAVYPFPQNAGHLTAARLTPPRYPYTVTGIRYELGGPGGNATCTNLLAHRVEVFKDSATKPAATPALLETFNNPAVASADVNVRLVSLTLKTPIQLAAGEHLYVAIEMPIEMPVGTNSKVVCVLTCQDSSSEADRNYWSNAKTPPYTWATLASFGTLGNLTIEALGAPN